tara:strand:- start:345 stop:461 length:117 start_codon:yes stop_codon:yes gene_type:complete
MDATECPKKPLHMEGLLVVNGLTYEMVTEPEPTVKRHQ